jgi:hypothetical protein
LWVRMDTVFGNIDGQTMYLLCGNPNANAIQSIGRVFDTANGFMGAYHLCGNLNDATINAHNGTDNGTVDTATGLIGRGRAFNGSSYYFHVDSLPPRPSGTISCWFRPKATFNSSAGKTQGIWGKKIVDSQDYTLSLMGRDFWTGGSNASGSLISKLETSDTGYYLNSKTVTFDAGVWYYVCFSWGSGQNTIYVNGVLEGSDAHSLPVYGEGSDEIGRSQYDASNISGGGPLYFNGTLDELRIEKVARSEDWIKLCAMNQRADDKLVKFEGK